MPSLTAAGTASVRHTAGLTSTFHRPVDIMARYRRRLVDLKPRLSDNRPEASIYAPKPPVPDWLSDVQTAIYKSTTVGPESSSDGRWLNQAVASAANDFFATTADLLPGRPFIYSSKEGDLVAEIETLNGSLTSIVSPTFVLLFAVVNGVPLQPRKVSEQRDFRREVQNVAQALASGQHGDLEAAQR
jgi:hypothetical protein